MRTLRYIVCDVFTDRPLEGNQLAVFTDARGLSDAHMQALAREMNFSETVFLLPATGDCHARLRIFTPAREVPFAGHPTLGSAFVVGTTVQLDVIYLETGSGPVPVRLEREGARVTFGWMRQPVPTFAPVDDARRAAVLAALGLGDARAVMPVVLYDNGIPHLMVALDDRAAVAAVRPDFARLGAAAPGWGVSTFAGAGRDWKTRMFAPTHGVPEDPATGSAAGPLAAHLALHGRIAFGDEIRIEQGAEVNRPSVLHARVEGATEDGGRIDRVEVGGAAVIVARGEFRLPI